MKYKHLFGPVPSRRLGISLGVDLVPHKTCSLNCIYCESGATTRLTVKRDEYVPVKSIMKELAHFLSGKPELDFITFSGAGEPTLHSGIGKIAKYIKLKFPAYKTALITNGTLLYRKKLRDELSSIDVIVPSLDAVSDKLFSRINRPSTQLNNSRIIKGLIALRKSFKNSIWLEIFIIPEYNDTEKELSLIKRAVDKIKPDKIQINSLDRPGTKADLKQAGYFQLKRIAKYFGNMAEVTFRSKRHKALRKTFKDVKTVIFETIKRRPCTAEDLSETMGMSTAKIKKHLNELIKLNKIEPRHLSRGVFYQRRPNERV